MADHDGWTFREGGAEDAQRTVLLLPGAFCTAAFYDEVLAEPAAAEAGLRLVAATPPGFGGNPAPPGFDMSIAAYAELVEAEAERLGAVAIVGHSVFANVLIVVAERGRFAGPLVLLSPCFSREDEEKDVRQMAPMARIPGVGALLFRIAPRMFSSSMKGRFPADRHDELVAEMKKNEPRAMRRLVLRYWEHLAEPEPGSGSGSGVALAQRLADSGAPASVVRGDQDEVGLKQDEAAILEAAPNVTVVPIPGARHFSMTDQPAAVAQAIVSAAAAGPPGAR
jgi:pimeloyl-ACP methyl ester carboxylesterase